MNEETKVDEVVEETKVEPKVETTEEETKEETKVEEPKVEEIDYKLKVDKLNEELKSISDQVKEKENKIKEYEQKEYERLLKENEKILSKFNINKDNPLYDRVQKVKDEFIFPKEGTKLSREEIEQNIKTFRIIEKTEIFNEIDKIKPPVIPAPSERKKTTDLRFENNPILR